MERENLKKSVVKTTMALRGPLAKMTLASERLEQCGWDEKGKGCIAVMNQGICQMLRIVGRMELSDRLDGEKPELKLASINLGGLTNDLGARMEGLLERAGVKLIVNSPELLLGQADKGLIQQLLLELVANGAKAVKEAEGSKEGKWVSLTLKRDGDNAVFTVEDNGPGVPPEKLPYLFASEKEEVPDWQQGGNGIAVARRIAGLHGGRLVPLCTPGRGLAMTVSIPLDQGNVLQDPGKDMDRGGFGEALVGLSHLLPVEVFAPGEYE